MLTEYCRNGSHRQCDTAGCRCGCHQATGPIARGEQRWTLTGYGLTVDQADRIIDELSEQHVTPSSTVLRDRAYAFLRALPRHSADN